MQRIGVEHSNSRSPIPKLDKPIVYEIKILLKIGGMDYINNVIILPVEVIVI